MFRHSLTSLFKSSTTFSSIKGITSGSQIRSFSKQFLNDFATVKTSPSSLLISQSVGTQQQRSYAISRKVKTKIWYENLKKEKVDGKGRLKYVRQQPEVNNTFILQQLSVLKKKRNWKRAAAIFDKLAETKSRPKVEVYRMLLYTIAYRGGEMNKAFEVFNYMKKYHPAKDVRSYNMLLHACSKHPVQMNAYIRDHDESTNSFTTAVQLYNEIKENNLQMTPFTISYMAKCVKNALTQNLLDENGKQTWLTQLREDAQAIDATENQHVKAYLDETSQAVVGGTAATTQA